VVLVDDVITTGTTLSECGRTLHAAGLRGISAVAFARA
jgi:predicted amidophosphoribosyltransferase